MYRRNMSGKLKKVVLFLKISTLLLLSRPFGSILPFLLPVSAFEIILYYYIVLTLKLLNFLDSLGNLLDADDQKGFSCPI